MYNSQETALRIKNIAKSKKISIAELQEKCGLGKNAINQLADSQDGMKSKNIYMIADYLNVSVDYLLGRTDNPTGYSGNNNSFNVGNNSTQTIGDNNNISTNQDISEYEREVLSIFRALSFKEQVKFLHQICNWEEELKKKKT